MSVSQANEWVGLNNGKDGVPAGELGEVVVERLIARYCRRGETAIDCGAADGRMLRPMLKAVGDKGTVVAFEPITHVFDALKANFRQRNVLLLQMCVSDAISDAVKFYHVKNRRWISSLSPDNLQGYDVEEVEVPVATLDSVLQSRLPGKKVSFIKLDIEGAEFSAIRGGRSIIERDRPVVVFENGLVSAAASFGYSMEQFFRFFDDLGYRLFDVAGTPLTADHWGGIGKTICWNFVAIHKEDDRLDDFVKNIERILIGARWSIALERKKESLLKLIGR